MQESRLSIEDLTQLSARERSRIRQRYALHRRYETAVSLYADTDASVREIAATCGESEHALRAYLRRYWRELMLRRYGIETEGKDAQEVPFYTADGQSCLAHRKYKEAVQACDSIRYIDLNVSQVARKFGVNATALANFMRVHYSASGLSGTVCRGGGTVSYYGYECESCGGTMQGICRGTAATLAVLSPTVAEREERGPPAGQAGRQEEAGSVVGKWPEV